MGRHRLTTALFSILAAAMLIAPASAAACGEGPEDTGPLINYATATPSSLPWEGGTVAVTTEVSDDCGIQQVYAEVFGPEYNYSFQMLPWEVPNSNTIVYHAEFQVLPNYQDYSVSYGVEVSAEDTNGAYAYKFAGETQVDAAPQFDEAPIVSNASVSPGIVGSGGGGVKISADASDDRSLNYVFAIVTYPDETQHEVPLDATSSSHFQRHFIAPPNDGAEFAQYSVIVYAEDDIGQQSYEKAGTFKVAPKTGKLNAWTSAGSYFGLVPLGQTAVRKVVVRNSGGPKTAPVTATVGTSGAPFAVKGGPTEFTLGPEELRVFEIEFQPATMGYKTGAAIVSRPDGAQPDIAVQLSGKGVNPPAD